jgi:hypothetical protein
LHMFFKYLVAIFAVLLGTSFAVHDSSAFMKRKDKTTVFEVPTTGKILDVKYHPEFDEWWVHCREGDNIVVYTYDHRNQTWAKVLFTPKKPDEKSQKVERLDRTKQPGEPGTVSAKEEQKPEPPKPEPKREPDKKWWDPLKLLQSPDKVKQDGK